MYALTFFFSSYTRAYKLVFRLFIHIYIFFRNLHLTLAYSFKYEYIYRLIHTPSGDTRKNNIIQIRNDDDRLMLRACNNYIIKCIYSKRKLANAICVRVCVCVWKLVLLKMSVNRRRLRQTYVRISQRFFFFHRIARNVDGSKSNSF